MIVELIPKREQKPIFGQVFFLIISITTLVSVGMAFFVLQQLIRDTSEVLAVLEKRFLEDTRPLEEEASAMLEGYKTKTEMLRIALDERKTALPFLRLLEQTTHPDVFFTDFNGDPKTGIFVLTGEARDFFALEQQRLVWKGRKEFESAVRNIQLGKEGAGSFEVEFIVKPELLDPL